MSTQLTEKYYDTFSLWNRAVFLFAGEDAPAIRKDTENEMIRDVKYYPLLKYVLEIGKKRIKELTLAGNLDQLKDVQTQNIPYNKLWNKFLEYTYRKYILRVKSILCIFLNLLIIFVASSVINLSDVTDVFSSFTFLLAITGLSVAVTILVLFLIFYIKGFESMYYIFQNLGSKLLVFEVLYIILLCFGIIYDLSASDITEYPKHMIFLTKLRTISMVTITLSGLSLTCYVYAIYNSKALIANLLDACNRKFNYDQQITDASKIAVSDEDIKV